MQQSGGLSIRELHIMHISICVALARWLIDQSLSYGFHHRQHTRFSLYVTQLFFLSNCSSGNKIKVFSIFILFKSYIFYYLYNFQRRKSVFIS